MEASNDRTSCKYCDGQKERSSRCLLCWLKNMKAYPMRSSLKINKSTVMDFQLSGGTRSNSYRTSSSVISFFGKPL
ncbi:unnamed protein product [Absidia cylindrospora]